MNTKFDGNSSPVTRLIALGLAIRNVYCLWTQIKCSSLTRRLYLTSYVPQVFLLFIAYWDAMIEHEWLRTTVEYFNIFNATVLASCMSYGIIHAVWFRSQRLSRKWRIIGSCIIFSNLLATMWLAITGHSKPVDIFEVAVIISMATLLGIRASEYTAAALNIYFGASLVMIALMFRDRMPPRSLYWLNNMDVYLILCRIGYIFVVHGMIDADVHNLEYHKTRHERAKMHRKLNGYKSKPR